MLLLAASAAEIFAGLKQSRDPRLLTGAAPKRQQRAELLSPYPTGTPARPSICDGILGTDPSLPTLQALSTTVG